MGDKMKQMTSEARIIINYTGRKPMMTEVLRAIENKDVAVNVGFGGVPNISVDLTEKDSTVEDKA